MFGATCVTCTNPLEVEAAFCGACGTGVYMRRESLAGTILDGRFHVVEKIAEGGFGAIYRAIQIHDGGVVALKVLHSDLASDRNLSARFRREGAALAALRDPHTLSTYAVGETIDGTLYIVMELLVGESLFERFTTHGRFGWRQMVAIAGEVCDALVEAHALGIVHRDLKPANIHLERRGAHTDYVKVLDFGIAKLVAGSEMDDGCELTRTGQAIGTLEYMSPEQLIGGMCDARSDLYTLGVVMYEMITGRRPFDEAIGPAGLITALLTQSPTPPSILCERVPVELDRVILRCLAADPDDRYADATELATALDDLLTTRTRPHMIFAYDPDDEPTNVDAVPSEWALGSAVGLSPLAQQWHPGYEHDGSQRTYGHLLPMPAACHYESIVRSDPARRRG
ncbi:MAG: serine/threonine protein kinase [Deltaproteobacteria bacterium]|nr:serine/threonine protein kinase [Deltaproteobacteria bacterium]